MTIAVPLEQTVQAAATQLRRDLGTGLDPRADRPGAGRGHSACGCPTTEAGPEPGSQPTKTYRALIVAGNFSATSSASRLNAGLRKGATARTTTPLNWMSAT